MENKEEKNGASNSDAASKNQEFKDLNEINAVEMDSKSVSAFSADKMSAKERFAWHRRRVLAEDLYRTHADSLWRYVRSRMGTAEYEDIADVTADIYASAWKSLLADKPPIETWSWLVGIARRRLADFWKTRKEKPSLACWSQLSADQKTKIETFLAGKAEEPKLATETKEALRAALSDLSPEAQELLIAHHVEGTSLKEIALRTKKTEAAVESALARARLALRQAFFRKT